MHRGGEEEELEVRWEGGGRLSGHTKEGGGGLRWENHLSWGLGILSDGKGRNAVISGEVFPRESENEHQSESDQCGYTGTQISTGISWEAGNFSIYISYMMRYQSAVLAVGT